MVKPVISVIIPTYNRRATLAKVLAAYYHQNLPEPYEIIVVDDASSDATTTLIEQWQYQMPHLKLITLNHNRGPAHARNRGLQVAIGDIILFTGDDIIPSPNFLSRHLYLNRKYNARHVAILGKITWLDSIPVTTVMKHIDGVGAQQFSFHYLQDGQDIDFRHFYTSNISISHNFLLEESYAFDENFPHAAFEDVDLGYRLSRRGLVIRYHSTPLAFHDHHHTLDTFFKRQYIAGKMAIHLTQKFFELAYSIQVERFYNLLGDATRQTSQEVLQGNLETRFQEKLIHNTYHHHPDLDTLYAHFFDYAYFKGMFTAIAPKNQLRVGTNILAHKILHPWLPVLHNL